MVGLSVTDYEKKILSPNRFQTTGVNTPISQYNPNKIQTLSTASSKPSIGLSSVGNTGNTALGGNAARISASPLLDSIPEPTFQPFYSGNNRSTMFGAGRLAAIDQVGELANEEISQKVMLRNAEIARRNRVTRQQDQWRLGSNPFVSLNSQGQDGESFFQGGENSGLDPEQLTNARLIADIGRRRGLGDNAIQIALMTALTESGLRNVRYGDRDSLGLFQQRPSQGWGTPQQVQDANYAANKFYDALSRTNYGGMSPWAAAQNVQRSFDPTGSNYQRQWALAQRAFGSLRAPVTAQSVGGNSGVADFITQNNNRYIDYDGAFGAQCVDLYNLYTARFVGGKNIMVGFADEIFNRYDTNAYAKAGPSTPGGMGYVAVFRRGGATPFSHVAIVVGDNGNGTLRVLHANATPAGSRGNTIISNISKATLMGYLIPKKLIGG